MEEAFISHHDVEEEIEVDGDPVQEDTTNNEAGEESSDRLTDDQEQDSQPQPDDDVDLIEALHVSRLHTEPVLAVRMSRNGAFTVTGGQDDVSHVWETRSGKLMFSCQDHNDSVHCVDINCTDCLVASADMSGLIRVFDVTSGEKIFDYEVDDIHWLCWHPISASALLVGTESGCVWLFNVEDHNDIKTLQGSGNGSSIGKVTECGSRLMAGYSDGSVRFWDLKSCSSLFTLKGNVAHSSSVTCIAFRTGQSIAATGSTDGSVKVINTTTGKVVASLVCGVSPGEQSVGRQENEEEDDADSVEAVAFCPGLGLLATATVSGCIEVWEVSSFQRRCFIMHEGGISGIRWDLTDSMKVHSAGLDGCLCTWDARDGKLQVRRFCHRDQILDFDAAQTQQQEDLIATASEDNTCRVFCINKY